MHLLYTLLCPLLLSLATAQSHAPPRPATYITLPTLRDQSSLQDTWTMERLDNVPNILKKHNVDAWLMSQHEHTEDTIFWSLKAFTQFSARRRTIDLFLANPLEGSPSYYSWIANKPSVWDEVLSVLKTYDPKTIVINAHEEIAFSAGLHVGELEIMREKLGENWSSRFVRVPMVGVEFVAWMRGGGDSKLGWYKRLMETAWAAIGEAFSERVITPGVTTTDDVEWWLRDKLQSLNYTTWFQPDVSILTPDSPIGKHQYQISSQSPLSPSSSNNIPSDRPIQHGDLLHVDFGLTALGMNTDTQHLAYVLYPGETAADIPSGLLAGLKKGNRLQDILIENMVIGESGNAILEKALGQMRKEGLEGRIYSHPIGDWGHSAGTLIGMTNLQSGVPILGDLPLLPETWYSIELYAEHFVHEWNATYAFYLEEDVYWDVETEGWKWVWGRQEEFHLVRSVGKEGDVVGELR